MPPGNDTAVPSTTAASTAPDISTTLQSNDFLNLPLDEKHKFLLRAVPEYAGLPPKEQAEFLQRFEPTLTQDDTDTGSVAGSFASRAWQTAKGAASMAFPQPTGNIAIDMIPPPLRAGYQMLKGQLAAEKKAGSQAVAQVHSAAAAPDAATTATQLGRAMVTGASMLDPLATSSVADINEAKDQGRTRDAIGTGAFDALMLLAGKGSGAPTEDAQLAKLTSAVGTQGGDTVGNLRTLLPDIKDEVAAAGTKPTKIGQLMRTVDNVKDSFNTTFGNAMNPIRNKAVMPSSISNALLAKITPNLLQTGEGMAEADALRNAAVEFQKPWTVDELNLERMRRGSRLDSYYNKGAGAQNSAIKSNVDLLIDKTVRDEAANIVYDEVDRANPGMDIKALKQRHSAAIQLSDQLHERVEALDNQQYAHQGKELGEKLRPHAYVGGSGIPRAHLSGLTEMLPGGGAMDYANTKVAKAFGPTAGATARRAAILSLPLTRLAGAATPMLEPPPPPPDTAQ